MQMDPEVYKILRDGVELAFNYGRKAGKAESESAASVANLQVLERAAVVASEAKNERARLTQALFAVVQSETQSVIDYAVRRLMEATKKPGSFRDTTAAMTARAREMFNESFTRLRPSAEGLGLTLNVSQIADQLIAQFETSLDQLARTHDDDLEHQARSEADYWTTVLSRRAGNIVQVDSLAKLAETAFAA